MKLRIVYKPWKAIEDRQYEVEEWYSPISNWRWVASCQCVGDAEYYAKLYLAGPVLVSEHENTSDITADQLGLGPRLGWKPPRE